MNKAREMGEEMAQKYYDFKNTDDTVVVMSQSEFVDFLTGIYQGMLINCGEEDDSAVWN
jgi:hypothetical protein